MIDAREQQFELFKLEIEKLLNGEIEEVVNKCLSIGYVESYLNDLGENLNDYGTNGWEHDYWNSWKINDVKYTLSGSGYYGGITFYKSDNE